MQPMIKKLWSLLSTFLILGTLLSFFFFPSLSRVFSVITILLNVGVSIFIVVDRRRWAQRAGLISSTNMRRVIALDVSGLLLTMSLVMFGGGKAGGYAAQEAGAAWGVTAGILAAIIAGLIAGVVIGLLVRWLWGKMTRPLLARAARPA